MSDNTLRDAVAEVLSRFRKLEELGVRNSDLQYAIEVLSKAMGGQELTLKLELSTSDRLLDVQLLDATNAYSRRFARGSSPTLKNGNVLCGFDYIPLIVWP